MVEFAARNEVGDNPSKQVCRTHSVADIAPGGNDAIFPIRVDGTCPISWYPERSSPMVCDLGVANCGEKFYQGLVDAIAHCVVRVKGWLDR